MLKSLVDLTTDVLKTVASPVEAAIDVTRCLTKPVADAAESAAKDIKEITED